MNIGVKYIRKYKISVAGDSIELTITIITNEVYVLQWMNQ